MLLQEQPTPKFSLGSVEFVFVPEWSIPGNVLHYVVKYGGDEIVLRNQCIDSVAPCDPRSNMDLTYHIWSTFEYYCSNYAILVLPTQTSGDKFVFVRQYQTEIGGETTRHCGRCVCMIADRRPDYDFCCKKLQVCTWVLCCRQPASLKSAASKIVFRMYNKEKFLFDNITTCRPIDIHPAFEGLL